MKRILPAPISRPDSPSSLGRQNAMLSIHSLPCPKRPRSLLVGLALFLLSVSVQAAGTLEEAAPRTFDDGRRTLKCFPVNILRGASGVFAPESLRPLLAGSALAGTGVLLDDEVKSAIADEDDALADFAGDYMGPAELGVVTLGLFIGGRFSEDPRFRAMTYDLAVSASVNLGYTSALKAAINRERPDGSDEDSFPSGHTSNAFALASVASAHYGKKVGIPAYVVASAIGVSRLRSNDHWLSDTLGGATLGTLVGWTVVRQNDKLTQDETSLNKSVSVMPILGPGFQGLQVEMTF